MLGSRTGAAAGQVLGRSIARRPFVRRDVDLPKLGAPSKVPPRIGGHPTDGSEIGGHPTDHSELHPGGPGGIGGHPGPFVAPGFDDTASDTLVGVDHAVIVAAVAAGPLVPVGVNAPGIWELESGDARYGDTDAILADLDVQSVVDSTDFPTTTVNGLGVQFFRQPIGADLLIPSSKTVVIEVPVDSAQDVTVEYLGTVPRSAVYTLLYDLLWEPLKEMFNRLGPNDPSRHPIKVVLTTLTLGVTSDDLTDPFAEYTDGRVSPRNWQRGGLPAHRDSTSSLGASTVDWYGTSVSIDDLYFSPGFAGTTAYTATTSADLATQQAFVYASFDPRSRYKLYYSYLLGKWSAQLLVDLRDALQIKASTDGTMFVDPFDSILAIEVGNELNQSNLADTFGVEEEATLWARAVRETTRGFQEVLASVRVVPLWLPSIAMYRKFESDSSSTLQDFADVLDWQTDILQKLVDLNSEEGSASEVDLSWFVNQDYHYYHYTGSQSVGHIAMLWAQVDALRSNLRAITDSSGAAPFAAGTISVCETGVPSTDETLEFDQYPYLQDLDSTHPSVTEWAAALERFQARQLWHRLSVALTTANPVAWHTHIGPVDGGFLGTGVRDDPNTNTLAREANTKLAWFAFQRLLRVLASPTDRTTGALGGVLPGTALLLPDSPDATLGLSEAYEGLDPTSGAAMCVILGFSPGTVADYAYVLFLDPVAATTTGAEVVVTRSRPGEVWSVPTVPASLTSADSGLGDDRYPTDTPDGAWNTVIRRWAPSDSVFSFVLQADMDPVLLLTQAPLSFTVTDVTL